MAKRKRRDDPYGLRELAEREGYEAMLASARKSIMGGYEGASQADVFSRFGVYLERHGRLDEAEKWYRAAIAEGGETLGEARALLAGLLARRGDRAGCDVLLDDIRRERSRDPWVYLGVADLLQRLGDVGAALTWANSGMSRLVPVGEEPSSDVLPLLSLRRDLRAGMGFPDDEYDLLAEEWLGSDDED